MRPLTAGLLSLALLACAAGASAQQFPARPVRMIVPFVAGGGAEDDLGSFGLDGYTHVETRSNVWNMNWKLVLDTFTESYHIRWLHKDSIAPAFNSDCVIFEQFGRNCASIGLRANVLDEVAKPKEEWSLLPYGTIQYFLVPNALLVHQLGSITTEQVYLELTFLTLAMLVVGGITSLWGAVVGALAISGLDSFLTQAEQGVHVLGFKLDLPSGSRLVCLAAIMALVLILRPSGLTGGRELRLPRRRRRAAEVGA